jgi:tRNA (guanine37-N1)-methyltransferase
LIKHGTLLLRVARTAGEKVRLLLRQLSLFDTGQPITRDEESIGFPLVRKPSPQEWDLIRRIDYGAIAETAERETPERKNRPHNVNEALRESIDPNLLAHVKHSFDIIGDIAIIEIPEELGPFKQLIAEGIVKVHKSVKTVLCKSGSVGGTFRVRDYELIIGEQKTETIHVEHGCRFMLDVSKVYFSPRLATEHIRVASQARASEVVVDMFAGIGPFSILIAKKKGAQVHSIDMNPDAIKYLKMNCILNKVEKLVHPMQGDARKLVTRDLESAADRVIMNLPSESLNFVDVACLALKPEGGVIHSYQFQLAPDPLEEAVEALRVKIESTNRKLRKVSEAKLVKSVAPHEWQVVVDAEVL